MAIMTEYKCPCCGGAIEFNTAAQKMKCPYCDTEFDLDTLEQFNAEQTAQTSELEWNDYDQTSGSGDWNEQEKGDLGIYVCESCGGQIFADQNTAATTCPYCGNHVVIAEKVSGMFRPDYVIPFQLDKKAAKQALGDFLKKKRLLPREFKSKTHMDSISGVYVPVWLFDCDAQMDARYHATRTHATHSDAKYNYIRTDHYMLTREGTASFSRVPVDGSSKMPDDMMEAMEPFDYAGLTDFKTAYLAGFLSDKYDVDAESSKPRANERITSSMQDLLSTTTGVYASVIPEQSNIQIKDSSIHYALLPVWMLNMNYQDKIYPFVMNGQTGKFVGDLPISRAAWLRWFLGSLAGSAVVIWTILSLIL